MPTHIAMHGDMGGNVYGWVAETPGRKNAFIYERLYVFIHATVLRHAFTGAAPVVLKIHRRSTCVACFAWHDNEPGLSASKKNIGFLLPATVNASRWRPHRKAAKNISYAFVSCILF